MNLKRILSSALVAIMLFAAITVLIPQKAEAAYSSFVGANNITKDEVVEIVEAYQKASYSSAEEMFQADLAQGYLDHSTNGEYSIYVNRYTGVMYYRNNLTGEMLTSNSYNYEGYSGAVEALTSQICVTYATISATENDKRYYSSTWAAKFNQITVTKIDNGLRVSYAIGDTANRCLLPIMIEANEFEKDILTPMMDTLYAKMCAYFGEENAVYYFESTHYDSAKIATELLLHRNSIARYTAEVDGIISKARAGVFGGLGDDGYVTDEMSNKIAEVSKINENIRVVCYAYSAYNPNTTGAMAHKPETIKGWDIPATLEGKAVYKVTDQKYSAMAVKAAIVMVLCPDYTFDMMYDDEKACGYVHKYEPKPVFRCALEYTFNDDGTLSVRLPSNSIVFDETQYILKNIIPLQYFGAGNFRNDGYFFIPDGSGSVIEFADFRNSNVAMSSSLSIYGLDYCYSEVSGAHKQPLTMPVYGIVSQIEREGELYNTGYFAILEEGASMAALNAVYTSTSFYEGSVYSTLTPYPSDKFDLSDTISVGNAQYYSMVSESKYAGSYVTRYVMLSDTEVPGKTNYSASYIGMANYYRNYLVSNGTLKELENLQDDLPLYIEALGSMEVIEKILTFPVNVAKSITTFDDVIAMYEELGRAKEKLLEKAEEYQALADAEDKDLNLKHEYERTAEDYRRLSSEIVNIDNINFKLTGFANGGMYFTYPTKVKWERVVGGKKGFKNLLEVAASYTDSDSNFGVYPDFDFQYINNTELFDGIGKRNTVSRMVDNRYASKQVYNSILGEYKSIYAMIVSADTLDKFYDKFVKSYSKYDVTGLSVSTLGSDLNSNFDKDNPVSRDEAQGYVESLLNRMANDSNYSLMISQGNMYAVKYADHILGVCTDSSYYRYSSYTIPFTGMILHGYVNYAGAALNYSGSPDYDILRYIENGASPYYVLGYQNDNVNLMKEDEDLNKYYSVSYENWFDDIVSSYAVLNYHLGDIQDYKIVDHQILIGERVIDESERVANLNALKKEFIEQFSIAFEHAIDAKLDELRTSGASTDYRIGVSTDIDKLVALAFERFELDNIEELGDDFRLALESAFAQIAKEYSTEGVDPDKICTVTVDHIEYESAYQYVTGSSALDKDYVHTDYTVDNDLIVMVVYQNAQGKTRTFILNYNIYAVEVTLNGQTYTIGKYDLARIDS